MSLTPIKPLYSGKALYHFVHKVLGEEQGEQVFHRGQKVLFLHTGGTVGLYDKEDQLLPLLPKGQVSRMTLRPPPPPSTS
jgi:D-cysteine desulfhydrase